MWYLKSNSSNVIPTHMVMSIKNARFKPQPSIPMQSFVTMRFTFLQLVSSDLIGITYLFWKLMTKGEKLEQRYDHGISWTTKYMFQGGEIKDGHEQGSNIKKMMDQNSWTKVKHTSRGSKLMNLVCLHFIWAYSCACLHCISF